MRFCYHFDAERLRTAPCEMQRLKNEIPNLGGLLWVRELKHLWAEIQQGKVLHRHRDPGRQQR